MQGCRLKAMSARGDQKSVSREHTHCSNDLRLETELVLEATSKVGDTSLAVTSHVWHLADVVVHVTTGEEEYGNQTDGGPEVTVLDDRKDIWCGDGDKGNATEDCNHCCHNLDIVDRPNDRGMGNTREVSGNPGMDWVGFVNSVVC